MKVLFRRCMTNNRLQREKYKFNLDIPKLNLVTFGSRSLSIQVQTVWNSLFY